MSTDIALQDESNIYLWALNMYKEKMVDVIDNLKVIGELLMPYSLPLVSADEENDVNYLKSREATVDATRFSQRI